MSDGLHIHARGILLDIEGTTSSIAFVHQVLFPYARQEMRAFLEAHGEDEHLRHAMTQIATEEGRAPDLEGALEAIFAKMDRDEKSTALKDLQGHVWEAGYRAGKLHAHVYPDVPAALSRWNADALDVRIFSSGSVLAQRLFFGHTVAGDLLPWLRGHYDTATGPKRASESYVSIAQAFGLAPAEIVYFSDIAEELEAARSAGFQAVLVERPGNGPVPVDFDAPRIHSFDQVRIGV